jgi:hypothetical protein
MEWFTPSKELAARAKSSHGARGAFVSVNSGVTAVLQLVFGVCSIVQGASCHELAPIPLEAGTTMIACAIASQIEGAKWAVAHPNHYIARATCRPAGAYARI